MQSGRWVVIEDIDRMPFELLSSIVSLLETNTLVLPGRADPLAAASGFQLFGTRSTTASQHRGGLLTPLVPPLSHFAGLWARAAVLPLQPEEMGSVLFRFVRALPVVSPLLLLVYVGVCVRDTAASRLYRVLPCDSCWTSSSSLSVRRPTALVLVPVLVLVWMALRLQCSSARVEC